LANAQKISDKEVPTVAKFALKKTFKIDQYFYCDPGSFKYNKIWDYAMLIYRYPKSKCKQIINTRAFDFTGINGISGLCIQLFLKTIPFYIKK